MSPPSPHEAARTRVRPAGLRRRSAGQSTVEFAIVLPLLMLALFACVKAGMAFFSYEQVASAANAGARAAAVNRAGDPTAAATAAAKSISPTLGLDDSQISVSYVSTASPAGAQWSYPGNVTVTVSYPVSFSIMGQFQQNFQLQATSTKRLER